MKIINKIVHSYNAPENHFVYWYDEKNEQLKHYVDGEWVQLITVGGSGIDVLLDFEGSFKQEDTGYYTITLPKQTILLQQNTQIIPILSNNCFLEENEESVSVIIPLITGIEFNDMDNKVCTLTLQF